MYNIRLHTLSFVFACAQKRLLFTVVIKNTLVFAYSHLISIKSKAYSL